MFFVIIALEFLASGIVALSLGKASETPVKRKKKSKYKTKNKYL